ncbi:unnamed protein product [Blepharisma stoltei]|uniref:Guanylate cyclase domain-containing protein n=1 Tax=Blepharisma stoltei TaxID=1481888 RepID=A0AAU9IFL1_9CILI|nr:unnamed protein product [Blepharisma stoltei]
MDRKTITKDTTNESEDWRSINITLNSPITSSVYPSNEIRSSRYNFWTFLPLNLFDQFMRPSNIWFLYVSLLEILVLSDGSVYSYSTIIPLVILLLFTGVKDALCNYQKNDCDKKINNEMFLVWNGISFMQKKAKEIFVGEVVLLQNKEKAPADLVLLCSGSPNFSCYLDTSGIIGEKDLKIKKSIREVQNLINIADVNEASAYLKRIGGFVKVQPPNTDFSSFAGKFILGNSPKATNLNIDNFIYRESKICNTPWIFGLVIYTGNETKIWKTETYRIRKSSRIEKWFNRFAIFLVAFILLLSLFEALMARFYIDYDHKFPFYVTFFRFNSVFSELIPLPLFFIIDIVKLIRYFRINLRKQGVQFKTEDACENLGQIEYLLADKTGTLTSDNLNIKLCLIGENEYWEESGSIDELRRTSNADRGFTYGTDRMFINNEEGEDLIGTPNSLLRKNFVDLKADFLSNISSEMMHYFTCLVLCNIAIPLENGEYLTTAVEDKALLELSDTIGVKLKDRDTNKCEISLNNDVKDFMIWGLRDATPENKRTRIIVQNILSDEAFIYVKGSLDTMLNIVKDPNGCLFNLENVLKESSTSGLQFIAAGYKPLKQRDLQEFKSAYRNAKQCPVNTDRRIESVFEECEQGIQYLGCIGIQEEITEETKETVEILKNAGIKIWILSGDSEDRTISAGIGSSAIQENWNIIKLSKVNSQSECLSLLEDTLKSTIFKENSLLNSPTKDPHDVNGASPIFPIVSVPLFESDNSYSENNDSQRLFHYESAREKSYPLISKKMNKPTNIDISLRKDTINPLISKLTSFSHINYIDLNQSINQTNLNFVLSIDNKILEICIEHSNCRKLLVVLLFTAQSVCFHSLLPGDKMKVAKLLKQYFSFKPIFLAIGDSGSDVGMIKEAHIGVGVIGKEGTQAASASEIVISKFSDLTELILCEGHCSYANVSKIILLLFYKSVLIISLIFFFTPVDYYSGNLISSLNLEIYIMVINIVNIIGIGVFDQRLNASEISEFPEMHLLGVYSTYFSKYSIMNYTFQGLLHAGIISIFLNYGFFDIMNDRGYAENHLLMEGVAFIVASIIVQGITILETSSHSYYTVATQIISFIIFLIYIITNSYTDTEYYGFLRMIFSSGRLVIYLCLAILLCLVISYAMNVYLELFSPSLINFINAIKVRLFNFEIISRINQYDCKLESVYKDKKKSKLETNIESFDINPLTLNFKSSSKQSEYNEGKYLSRLKHYRILVVITLFIFILATTSGYTSSIGALVVFMVLNASFLVFTWTKSFRKFIRIFVMSYYVAVQVIVLVTVILTKFNLLVLTPLYPLLYALAFNIEWPVQIVCNVISTIIILIKTVIVYNKWFDNTDLAVISIQYFILWISIEITAIIVAYSLENASLKEFILIRTVRTEMIKAKDVLELLLPKFVVKRVKEGIRYISDDQGIVSVLFCNICDFDQIINDYTPQEITNLLDEVYGKLDQLCELVGVTKIETVGKTYMACAGLKDSETELDYSLRSVSHTRRVIEMGIEIINYTQKIMLRSGDPIHVQIGINSGPVTAGVVGAHKPQFSLVGDTVNTASRMASTLKIKDAIQISMSTYELLSNRKGLSFIPQNVYAKGKGNIDTFLVKADTSPESLLPDATPKRDSFRATNSLMPTISMHVSSFCDPDIAELSPSERRRLSSGRISDTGVEERDRLFEKKETELVDKMKIISFKQTNQEKIFRKAIMEDNYINLRIGLLWGIIAGILSFIIQIVWVATDTWNTLFFLIFFPIESIGFLIFLIFLKKYHTKQWYTFTLQVCFMLCLAILIIVSIYVDSNLHSLISICSLYHIMLLTHVSSLLYVPTVIFSAIIILGWLISEEFVDVTNVFLDETIFMIFFTVVCLISLYFRIKRLWTYSSLRTNSQNELNTIEELVNKMMPRHAYMNLKDKQSVTDRFSQVTILYADIVGFTAWSSDKSPEEILGMLYELFSRFDNLCVAHNVYKVHTIGDCYVAMGNSGNEVRDPGQECVNMVEFAQSMIKVIQEVNEINGIQLNMRIGMHTGDVIGGIIGGYIVRYDIYGAGVLVANLMESNGIPGKIAVSEVTQMLLKRFRPSKYQYEHLGEVNVPILLRSFNIYAISDSI